MKPFVNPVDMQIPVDETSDTVVIPRSDIAAEAFVAEHVVTEAERAYILDFLSQVNWQPVSITGMQGNYEPGDPIGSWRASSFQEEYAQVLFERIKPFIPAVRHFDEDAKTDWDHHEQWEAVGINPLLRFIKYTDGGMLVPHYDAPYVASDEERTLMSFVVYLDNDPGIEGGAVRFLHDPQADIRLEDRNLDDLADPASDEDVRLALHPTAGSALAFDHRILHESQLVKGNGQKTIIRTDIVYCKK